MINYTRPSPVFPYCKRRKAGQGLGMRLRKSVYMYNYKGETGWNLTLVLAHTVVSWKTAHSLLLAQFCSMIRVWTTGLYWSYMLFIKLPFLCILGLSCACACKEASDIYDTLKCMYIPLNMLFQTREIIWCCLEEHKNMCEMTVQSELQLYKCKLV